MGWQVGWTLCRTDASRVQEARRDEREKLLAEIKKLEEFEESQRAQTTTSGGWRSHVTVYRGRGKEGSRRRDLG